MRRGCPEGDCVSPSRLELLGAVPPMAPGEDCPTPAKNQPPTKVPWRKRRARRPRRRVCLLKGCGHVFRPQQPLARYCSEACCEQARRWRQWKARRRYRRSSNGQQRRRAQSRRYRERRKERPARENRYPNRREGHPYKFFLPSWVVLLRPPGVLCGIPAHQAVPGAAVLFPGLPTRSGAGSREGEALEPAAPQPEVAGSPGEKGPAPAVPAAMRASGYRPDILRSTPPPQ